MDYDKIFFNIYIKIFGNNEIKNNDYRFIFLNCDNNFLEFAENYYKILGIKISRDIIELSILFEYVYLNNIIFLKIIEHNGENECLDLLTFLNVNINITKNINIKLKKINSSKYVIDILNNTKYTDYINKSGYDINKIKKSLVDIFYKIISR
jgi:hypothetical protein